jgi:hypothetical protein
VSIPLFPGNCHILVSSQIVSIRLFRVAQCRRYARHAIYHSKEVLQHVFTCFKDSEKTKCAPSRTTFERAFAQKFHNNSFINNDHYKSRLMTSIPSHTQQEDVFVPVTYLLICYWPTQLRVGRSYWLRFHRPPDPVTRGFKNRRAMARNKLTAPHLLK